MKTLLIARHYSELIAKLSDWLRSCLFLIILIIILNYDFLLFYLNLNYHPLIYNNTCNFSIFGLFFTNYSINKIKDLIFNNIKSIITCLIIVSISFIFPSFQYYLMLTISTGVLLMTFSFVDYYIQLRYNMVRFILKFLDELNILVYFERIYIYYFTQPNNIFLRNTTFIYIGCFLYVLISKYLFINKNNLHSLTFNSILLLYVLLFISLITVYIRVLLNTSILLHNLSWSILKTEELPFNGDSSPQSDFKNSAKPSGNSYNIFNFSKTFNYSSEQTMRNAIRFKYAGLGIGICTLCVAGYAGYQQRLQTIAAQEQVRVQEINNREMTRQNDLEEVSQGMMSKEDYQRKHNPIK